MANANSPFPARDRIALLLDFDSPFLELCPFAGHKLPNSNNCANIIAGIGIVRLVQIRAFLAPESSDSPVSTASANLGLFSGMPCLLMSHIPTQDGGAWNEYTVQKVNRIMEIGMENDLPLISLVQSVYELALIPLISNKISMLTLCV